MEMVDLDVSKIFGNHIWPAEWSDGLWDASDQKTIWKNAPEVNAQKKKLRCIWRSSSSSGAWYFCISWELLADFLDPLAANFCYSLAANFFGLLAANFSPHRTCHHCNIADIWIVLPVFDLQPLGKKSKYCANPTLLWAAQCLFFLWCFKTVFNPPVLRHPSILKLFSVPSVRCPQTPRLHLKTGFNSADSQFPSRRNPFPLRADSNWTDPMHYLTLPLTNHILRMLWWNINLVNLFKHDNTLLSI